MKKRLLYFCLVFVVFVSFKTKAQLPAPSLRCLSVSATGDVTLTWVVPPDPSGIFTRYQIFTSPTQLGPYALVTSITTQSQSSFVHTPGNANIQAQYYYMVTVSNGTVTSTSSDTLRTMFLNLTYPFNGVVTLDWNAMHTPVLPTASGTYTLSREFPAGTWTPIYTGTDLQYRDTITICNVSYNYKVETSDNAGCTSQSNIKGGIFSKIQPPHIPQLDSISVNTNNSLTMGWQPSSSTETTSYIIYKIVGGAAFPIDTVFGYNNTTYTFFPQAGTSGYCIAASDSCGNVSITSIGHQPITLSTSYDLCGRTANLSWTNYMNLPKGVLRYDVYCSVNGGAASLIGSTASTNFSHDSLTPGDTYCYYVRVVNTPEIITASSNQSCVTATAPQGPSMIYVNSVSVNLNKQVEVTYTIDDTKPYKGVTIYKSLDGITFSSIAFHAAGSGSTQTYTDTDVSPTEKNYFYQVQIIDSCGNSGNYSNISKTILLKVSNDNANIFYNTLTWNSYSLWSGNVASYNIYRAVNGVFDPVPIANVGFAENSYTDNVEDFTSDQGKFSYYVEAVEGSGNIYGFSDKATSNPADAYVEAEIYVPNAFAPKGLNNIWLPVAQYVEKTDYKVRIFDRWGTKVFETSSDTEGWTGNGATDEVYVYLIEYKNARGEYIQLKGHLTLVK